MARIGYVMVRCFEPCRFGLSTMGPTRFLGLSGFSSSMYCHSHVRVVARVEYCTVLYMYAVLDSAGWGSERGSGFSFPSALC